MSHDLKPIREASRKLNEWVGWQTFPNTVVGEIAKELQIALDAIENHPYRSDAECIGTIPFTPLSKIENGGSNGV